MKTSFLMLSVIVLLAFISIEELSFNIRVQNADEKNILASGLEPSELAQLTIEASHEDVRILEFHVIHARGESPLNTAVVTDGNTFDLARFRDKAKTGDRIVIEVSRVSGSYNNKLTEKNRILQIPIR